MQALFPRLTLVLLIPAALFFAGCIGSEGPEGGLGLEDGNGADLGGNDTENETSPVVLEASLAWTAGITGCTTLGELYLFADALQGVDHDQTPLREEAQGQRFNATIASAAPVAQWGVSFWDGEDLADASASDDDTLEGTVPDPSDTAIFWSCGGSEVEVAFAVSKQ